MSDRERCRAHGTEKKGRLIWALFCEDHTVAQDGRSNYLGVFDVLTVAVRASPGHPPPAEPLPSPVSTRAFVLALHVTTEPGSPECEVRIKDSDGEAVLPPVRSRLGENPQGRHNVHIRFPGGLPVVRSGICSFEVYVAGAKIGEAQIPVSIHLG